MKHIKSVKYPMPSKFHGSVRRFAHRVGKIQGGGGVEVLPSFVISAPVHLIDCGSDTFDLK